MPQPDNPNSDPFRFTLSFHQFLVDVYDGFTGRKSTMSRKKETLPDGSTRDVLVIESVVNEAAVPLCNDTGGDFLVRHLRYIYNQHVALGELNQNEIAELAETTIGQPIDIMMFYPQDYGVANLAKLDAEGLALYNSLYTYLTSLKDAGLRKFGEGTLQINWITRPREEPKAQANLYGNA